MLIAGVQTACLAGWGVSVETTEIVHQIVVERASANDSEIIGPVQGMTIDPTLRSHQVP